MLRQHLGDLYDWTTEEIRKTCDCKVQHDGPSVLQQSRCKNWIRFTETAPDGQRLIKALQNGKAPACAHVLPGCLPPVPEAFKEYARTVVADGGEVADSGMYEDAIISPPEKIQQFMSGNRKSCRFSDWKNASFLGALFHHIQMHSPTNVELSTWDLFHGHMFVHVDETEGEERGETKLEYDIGLLFHAREFPMEIRRNQIGKTIPVGSPMAGGKYDVRCGTKCSIYDSEYYLRNYIWLMSTNQIVVLDTHAPNLSGLIQNREFHTVGSGCFQQVGDINYFPPPWLHNISLSLRHTEGQGLQGGSAPHAPAMVAGAGDTTFREAKKRTGKSEDTSEIKSDIFSSEYKSDNKSENKSENKSGGSKRGEVEITRARMSRRRLNRWVGNQVSHYIANSRDAASFVYPTPLANLASPMLRIKNADNLETEIKRMDERALTTLDSVCSGDEKRIHPKLRSRIPGSMRSAIRTQIAKARTRRREKHEQYEVKQLKLLTETGIKAEEGHAKVALRLTRSVTGLSSAFRAEHLLKAALSRYRPPDLLKDFGEKDYSLVYVRAYQAHAFYAASTLRAIRLDASERLGAMEAGRRVAEIVTIENEKKWERSRRRRALIVNTLEAHKMDERLIQIMYSYEMER